MASPIATALRPGFYLGPWPEGNLTRWVALYVGNTHQAATYDPPAVAALCAFNASGDSVEFTSGRLTHWPTSEDYTFTFRGARTATAMKGTLLMNGGPYPSKEFATEFRYFPTDTTVAPADTAMQGLFRAVRMVGEGDLLGDELLLVKSGPGFLALYTAYGGVPVGPSLVDSLQITGDTIAVVSSIWGTKQPLHTTFILTHDVSPRSANSAGPEDTDNPSRPIHLPKTAGLGKLFGPARNSSCVSAPSKN